MRTPNFGLITGWVFACFCTFQHGPGTRENASDSECPSAPLQVCGSLELLGGGSDALGYGSWTPLVLPRAKDG